MFMYVYICISICICMCLYICVYTYIHILHIILLLFIFLSSSLDWPSLITETTWSLYPLWLTWRYLINFCWVEPSNKSFDSWAQNSKLQKYLFGTVAVGSGIKGEKSYVKRNNYHWMLFCGLNNVPEQKASFVKLFFQRVVVSGCT